MYFTQHKQLKEAEYWAIHKNSIDDKNINPIIVSYDYERDTVIIAYCGEEYDADDFYYGDEITFNSTVEVESE